MAGTLTISTLSDGTNSTSATNCIQGSAKAWVNFNGSTAGIRASYNVSSITRSGGGIYYMTFTNAFSDINYSVVGSASVAPGNFGFFAGDEIASRTTSRTGWFYTVNGTNTNSAADANNINIAVFR